MAIRIPLPADELEKQEMELAKAIFDREEQELLDIPERYYVGFFGGKVDSIWEKE